MSPSTLWLVAVLAGLSAGLVLPTRPELTRGTLAARDARPGAGPDAGPDSGRIPWSGRGAGSGATGGAGAGRASGGWLRGVLALGAGSGAWFLLGGHPGIVAGAAAGGFAWRALASVEPRAQRRWREQLERQLPQVVDLMASSLAVGSSPPAALRLVVEACDAPVRDELARATRMLRLGADPVRVWTDLAGHPQLGPLGRCLVRATESGASVAEAMHRLGDDLRRQARAEVEERARAVGVRAAAPLGLCLLPAFILLGIVPLVAGALPLLLGR